MLRTLLTLSILFVVTLATGTIQSITIVEPDSYPCRMLITPAKLDARLSAIAALAAWMTPANPFFGWRELLEQCGGWYSKFRNPLYFGLEQGTEADFHV